MMSIHDLSPPPPEAAEGRIGGPPPPPPPRLERGVDGLPHRKEGHGLSEDVL